MFEGVFGNYMFLFVSIFSLGLQVFLVEVGGDFLRTSPLDAPQWFITIALGFLGMPIGVLMRFFPCEEDPESFFTPKGELMNEIQKSHNTSNKTQNSNKSDKNNGNSSNNGKNNGGSNLLTVNSFSAKNPNLETSCNRYKIDEEKNEAILNEKAIEGGAAYTAYPKDSSKGAPVLLAAAGSGGGSGGSGGNSNRNTNTSAANSHATSEIDLDRELHGGITLSMRLKSSTNTSAKIHMEN